MTTDYLGPRPEWMQRGLCAQPDAYNSDLWFPENTGPQGRIAKAVCRQCPVRDQCLDYAISNGEKYGIWAGTSERKRRDMIAKLRAAKRVCVECATPLTNGRRTYCSDNCYDTGHRRDNAAAAQRRRDRGAA